MREQPDQPTPYGFAGRPVIVWGRPQLAAFYDPQGVLIDWKDGGGWDLTSALAGTLVTGSIGSGKSSGPGAMLRKAFLRSTTALRGGMGGMVFFAKNGECDEWVKVCQQNGRGQDVIRVTPGGRFKFNFMDWIAQFGASDGKERGTRPDCDGRASGGNRQRGIAGKRRGGQG
jgi:hypothetical protein